MHQLQDTETSTGSGRRAFLKGVAAVVIVGIGAGVGRTAHAATPVGSVAIDGLGQFDILSYSWGSNSKVHDISVTKLIDGVSSALLTAVASGTVFPTGTISVTGKNGKITRYDITSVLVTALTSGSGTSDGNATENVTLHFATIKTAHK